VTPGPVAAIAGICAVCFGGALVAASALRGGPSIVPIATRAPVQPQRPQAELAALVERRPSPGAQAALTIALRAELAQSRRRQARRSLRAQHRTRVHPVVPAARAPAPQRVVLREAAPPPQPVHVQPAPRPAPVTPKPVAPKPVAPKPVAPKPVAPKPSPPPPTTTFFSSGGG